MEANSTTQHKPPITFWWLCLGWFVLNVLQGIFTEIGNDEAYYWMYSRYLDWGYFDHPPMIALFIKAGTSLLSGELGTRLITMISQLASIYLIWKSLDKPHETNPIYLFGLMFIIPCFATFGFIATPDSPLLFFTALFFFSYRKFLSGPSLTYTLLLGLSMAGMMYSKYHGLLVIVFTLFADLRILRERKIWFAAIISLILFLPHLAWQLRLNFPTFTFQTNDRINDFHIQHFLEFWLSQAMSINPFILILTFILVLKIQPIDTFNRSLKFTILGFFGFFWISSLWIRSEPHWTAAASIPMIILLANEINHSVRMKKWAGRFILVSLPLIILARLSVIFEIMPFHVEFLGQKEWVQKVEQEAGELPAMFMNTYQKPSVYSFYTSKPALALNNIYYRKTQYDLWAFDVDYQGKEVAFFVLPSDSISIPSNHIKVDRYLSFKDTLMSTYRLDIIYRHGWITPQKPGEKFTTRARILNPYRPELSLSDPSYPIEFNAVYRQADKIYRSPITTAHPLKPIRSKAYIDPHIEWNIPQIPPGEYILTLGFRTARFPEGFNSIPLKIKIQ